MFKQKEIVMKFRNNSVANNRRILSAAAKLVEYKSIEKEITENNPVDIFWVLVWTFLGHIITCYNHRSLMECFVLQDKASAKRILQKIFLKVVTSIRCNTQWSGYQNYMHSMWLVNNYHVDQGCTMAILLERALLAIKNDKEDALNEALEAIILLCQKDDAPGWSNYEPDTLRGQTWASYSPAFLENPVKLEAPEFEWFDYWSECFDNCVDVFPEELYVSMDAFKRLLNGGLRLSEPTKIIGKKLP